MGATRSCRGTVFAVGIAVTLTSGCAAVPGSGSAGTSDIAAYQSTLAQSRAQVAAAAQTAACTAWRAAYTDRSAATKARVDFTQNPDWNWTGIAPTLQAELAAIGTEKQKLTSTLVTAEPAAALHEQLLQYQTKLGAYEAALRRDAEKRQTEAQTWDQTRPAADDMTTAIEAVAIVCKG